MTFLARSYKTILTPFNSHRHKHDKHQVLIATQGLILFEDELHRHILSGKNAAFIPAGVHHCAKAMGDNIAFETVYFQETSFASLSGISPQQLPQTALVFRASALFHQLLGKLCEKQNTELNFEPYITSLKLMYLLLCEEREKVLPIALPQTQNRELQQILLYIDNNYSEEITLGLLEEKFLFSRRTIERMFKKQLHLTMGEYLRLRRIFEASVLLSTSEFSILQIALKVGYNSLSSFYKSFSEIVGETPRKYRLTNKNAI